MAQDCISFTLDASLFEQAIDELVSVAEDWDFEIPSDDLAYFDCIGTEVILMPSMTVLALLRKYGKL